MNPHRQWTVAALVAAGLWLTPLATLAAEPDGASEPQAAPPAAGDLPAAVDPQRLDRFVDVFVDLQAIHEDAVGQLQSVETEDQALALRRSAQNRMIAAVESRGMSVDEYNEIALEVQRDPELLEQVRAMAAQRM